MNALFPTTSKPFWGLLWADTAWLYLADMSAYYGLCEEVGDLVEALMRRHMGRIEGIRTGCGKHVRTSKSECPRCRPLCGGVIVWRELKR